MPLIFLTNQNSITFHIIDYGSKWDYHVSDDWNRFFADEGILDNEQYKLLLKNYTKIRSELSWNEEGKLHLWAYEGFKDGLYDDLKNIIFELKNAYLSKSKITINDYAKTQLFLCKDAINQIENSIKEENLIDKMITFAKLCPNPQLDISINAFIFTNPHDNSTQGGANGGALFTEISRADGELNLKKSLFMVLHEYFHKLNNLFCLYNPNDPSDYWNKEYKEIHTYNFSLFGEIFTRTVVNYILYGRDESYAYEKLKKYDSKNQKDTYEIIVINGIIKFLPVLREFSNTGSKSDVFEKLVTVFKEHIKNY